MMLSACIVRQVIASLLAHPITNQRVKHEDYHCTCTHTHTHTHTRARSAQAHLILFGFQDPLCAPSLHVYVRTSAHHTLTYALSSLLYERLHVARSPRSSVGLGHSGCGCERDVCWLNAQDHSLCHDGHVESGPALAGMPWWKLAACDSECCPDLQCMSRFFVHVSPT